MKKNNSLIGVLLIILIVMLLVGAALFYTGTIQFNKQENNETKTEESTKKSVVSNEEAISIGTKLYDKATEIFSTWKLLPYCGYTLKEVYNMDGITIDTDNDYIKYYPAKYDTINDLKNDLANYLSNDIIEKNVNENDTNYYKTKDNKLYCRKTLGNGWVSFYLNDYTIKVSELTENKITYSITSTYAKDITECENNKDTGLTKKSCKEDNLETKDSIFTIEKTNSNWVVTNFTLHD